MASKIQAKQIQRLLSSSVLVTPVSVAALANNHNVTAALTTALNTAGIDGTAVPLQAYTAGGTTGGVFTTAPNNRVDLWIAGLETKLSTATGQEVFGEISLTAGVYKVSFFYLDSTGTKTAFNIPAAVDLTMGIPYVFEFHQIPVDAFASVRQLVYQDPTAAASNKTEALTVTATDTLSALSMSYVAGGMAELNVNGQVVDISTTAFSIAGTVVTWSAANAGYSLETTDSVVATYAIA